MYRFDSRFLTQFDSVTKQFSEAGDYYYFMANAFGIKPSARTQPHGNDQRVGKQRISTPSIQNPGALSFGGGRV